MSFAFQKVEPKGSPGVAQPDGQQAPPAGGSSSGGGALGMLFPLLIMVPFLFLMFRRQKKEQQQRSSMKKGDMIVSQSGLVGELIEMDERFAKVKIAPGTTVKMLVTSLSPLGPDPDKKKAEAAADADLKDLKDAKVAGAAEKK